MTFLILHFVIKFFAAVVQFSILKCRETKLSADACAPIWWLLVTALHIGRVFGTLFPLLLKVEVYNQVKKYLRLGIMY